MLIHDARVDGWKKIRIVRKNWTEEIVEHAVTVEATDYGYIVMFYEGGNVFRPHWIDYHNEWLNAFEIIED